MKTVLILFTSLNNSWQYKKILFLNKNHYSTACNFPDVIKYRLDSSRHSTHYLSYVKIFQMHQKNSIKVNKKWINKKAHNACQISIIFQELRLLFIWLQVIKNIKFNKKRAQKKKCFNLINSKKPSPARNTKQFKK